MTDYCSRCGHDLKLSSYWRGCKVEGCGCGLYAPTNLDGPAQGDRFAGPAGKGL